MLIEGANPRHEHEWEVWGNHKFPGRQGADPRRDRYVLQFRRAPALVAQRIIRYAQLVGRERVIAGTDCGFGTFAGFGPVHPDICWLKLKSLREGADLATAELWAN